MSDSVVDQLVRAEAEQKAEAQGTYAALARDLADGRPRDEGEVVQIVTAAGVSLHALKAEVGRLVVRIGLARALEDLPQLEADERAAAAKVEEARESKVRAIAQHDSHIRAANRHLSEVRRELQAVRDAREDLIRTAAPELRARVDQIGADIGTAESTVVMLRNRIKAVESERAADESPHRPQMVVIDGEPTGPRRGETPLEARAREEAAGTWGRELEQARGRGVAAEELETAANAAVVRNRAKRAEELRAEWASKIASLQGRLAEAEKLLDALRAERAAAVAALLIP